MGLPVVHHFWYWLAVFLELLIYSAYQRLSSEFEGWAAASAHAILKACEDTKRIFALSR